MQTLTLVKPALASTLQFITVKNTKIETIESFLNRGGVITKLPPKKQKKMKPKKSIFLFTFQQSA